MTNEFKIKENGFSEFSKSKFLIVIAGLLVISIIVLGIKTEGFTEKLETLIVVAPIVFVVFTLILFFSFKMAKKKFESLIITVNETEIIKKQKFEKDLSIQISDVTEISRDNSERLIIKGKSNMQHEMIFIPKQIEKFDIIENLLSNISTIKEN